MQIKVVKKSYLFSLTIFLLGDFSQHPGLSHFTGICNDTQLNQINKMFLMGQHDLKQAGILYSI